MGQPPMMHPYRPPRRVFGNAYQGAWIAVTILGIGAAPMLLCAGFSGLGVFLGCYLTLMMLALPLAGVLWWLRQRQRQEETALSYAAWWSWQEQQRQAMLAAQERERRLAYDKWLADQRRQQRLQHLRTLGDLLAKTPQEFELAIADLLPSLGYVGVQHTGQSGDMGADILCRTRSGTLVIVQCKQYASGKKVSRPELQRFMGALMTFDAGMGLFVTTASFTSEARALAEKHSVVAIDGEWLTRLLHSVQAKSHA